MAAITAITTERSLPSTQRMSEFQPSASGLFTTGPGASARRTGPERVPRWARLEPMSTGPTTPGGRRRQRAERVFRRRRLVAAVVVALLAFAAGVVLAVALSSVPAGGSLTDAAEAEDLAARQTRHVVDVGDTLWTVAHRVAPDEDPRVVVDALADARGTSTIVPGDTIVWPLD